LGDGLRDRAVAGGHHLLLDLVGQP
jgi:hypothetical protein